MANNLKASVNIDVSKAERNLTRLLKKINNVQDAINNTTSSNRKVETAIKQKTAEEARFNKQVNNTNNSIQKQKNLFTSIGHSLKGIAAAYLGVMGATAMINTSDTITSAENKFNNLNGGDTAATQQQLDKMYNSAQKVRMGYADMMSNVGKSMTLAGDAFGGNIDNAIRFQEIMAEAYTLGGASAAEMSSSMYQMIQGLGSGILQGDELRSVREGAPLAYKAIEEFAQGIFGAEENLKDLASQGKITSDIVVAAIMRAGEGVDGLDAKFKNTSMTFAQAGQMLKNTATKTFEPVLQKLNDILNSNQGKKFISIIGNALVTIATAINGILTILTPVFNFVIDNWEIIEPLVLGGLAAIIGMIVMMNAGLIKLFVTATIGAIGANAAWLGWIAIIALVIALIVKVNQGVADLSNFIINAALIVAGVIMAVLTAMALKAILTGVIFTMSFAMWVFFALAILLVLLAAFLAFTKQIVGFAYGLGSAISAIFTNIKLAFQNILLAMQYLFWKWIDNIVSDFRPLLEAINAVLTATGKKTINIDFAGNKAKALSEEIGFVSVGDAYKEGYAKGEVVGTELKNKINNWGTGLKNKLSTDGLTDKLGLDYSTFDDIAAADAITADNTGKMADSMELTAEDLAYLKDVANMEWKKEFTTANITVDMTNNNTVSNDFDLNSLAIGLRDLVEEEMFAVANGVYA